MKTITMLCILIFLMSCSAAYHKNPVNSKQENEMKVSVVPIKKNIDQEDNGNSVHDKIVPEISDSKQSVTLADKTGECRGKKLLLFNLIFN